MESGTIVRHLVLPMCVEDSKKIIDWFCNIKDKAYIDIMSQYTPCGEISDHHELQRPITKREYNAVLNYAISKGITNAYYQKFQSQSKVYIPKWDF